MYVASLPGPENRTLEFVRNGFFSNSTAIVAASVADSVMIFQSAGENELQLVGCRSWSLDLPSRV